MKFRDIVECVGENESVARLVPQVHANRCIDREEWSIYMAEPLRALWHMVSNEKDAWLLQKATYADWEEFCWRLTTPLPQAKYSQRLCQEDEL